MRSLPQNDCLHKWCRIVRDHINANRRVGDEILPMLSEDTVKELVLLKLGNTRLVLGEKVAMRSSKYRETDAELTDAERRRGDKSMSALLSEMAVWAATDLGLVLERDVEQQVREAG